MTTITVSDTELDKLISFSRRHRCEGMLIFITQSSSSGIGQNTEIACECGVKENATDYSLW